jgi:acyl dehydratase
VVVEIIAHNYAADHANRIHSDEGAAEYGYPGALVPGVAMYAYLTRPVIASLGLAWIERGAMSVKLLKPVYHGDRLRVEETAGELQLSNDAGMICAVGTASMPALPVLQAADYPRADLPGRLRPATIAGISIGDLFGSLEFTMDLDGDVAPFHRDILVREPLFDAIPHPAYWIASANDVVMQNVALGMWIHTASEARHFAVARAGEPISIRSRVVDAFEKRGHELLTLDIGIFGESERPIARVVHTAIIRLRQNR